MSGVYRKSGSPAQIAWEARGLAWLAAAQGAAVVPILGGDERSLQIEYLSPAPPTPAAAEAFGRSLAVTHAAGADSFGAPPAGWDAAQPGWIGRARLPLGQYARWGEFYAELRVLPHAEAAHRLGRLSSSGLASIERVCQRLRDGQFDDGRPPARLHGDLWAGNAISTAQGFVLIDPAAHGGHGETDLAMLALFGFPHLSLVQDAYAEAAQLADGWQSRVRLHQLHPLLVHAELFGGHYGIEAAEVADEYS